MTSRVAFLGLVALAEIGLYLRARFETWRRQYETVLYAWLAIHWRLVGWFFTVGALCWCALLAGQRALVESGPVTRVIEAAVVRYWRLHGYLEYRLVVGLTRLGEHRLSLRNNPTNSLSVAFLGTIAHEYGRAIRLIWTRRQAERGGQWAHGMGG